MGTGLGKSVGVGAIRASVFKLLGGIAEPASYIRQRRTESAPAAPAMLTFEVVTGILEGDDNVAILKWTDSQRQVVRVGDHLDGGYTVKAIRADGVLVAHGSHEWLMRLGNSH